MASEFAWKLSPGDKLGRYEILASRLLAEVYVIEPNLARHHDPQTLALAERKLHRPASFSNAMAPGVYGTAEAFGRNVAGRRPLPLVYTWNPLKPAKFMNLP